MIVPELLAQAITLIDDFRKLNTPADGAAKVVDTQPPGLEALILAAILARLDDIERRLAAGAKG